MLTTILYYIVLTTTLSYTMFIPTLLDYAYFHSITPYLSPLSITSFLLLSTTPCFYPSLLIKFPSPFYYGIFFPLSITLYLSPLSITSCLSTLSITPSFLLFSSTVYFLPLSDVWCFPPLRASFFLTLVWKLNRSPFFFPFQTVVSAGVKSLQYPGFSETGHTSEVGRIWTKVQSFLANKHLRNWR